MENKTLCGCHNVTLHDVLNHIKDGVTTFKELQEITNIGKDCPPCYKNNKALFEELLENNK